MSLIRFLDGLEESGLKDFSKKQLFAIYIKKTGSSSTGTFDRLLQHMQAMDLLKKNKEKKIWLLDKKETENFKKQVNQ